MFGYVYILYMSHAFHFKEPCQFATVEKIAAKHLQSLLKVFILVIPLYIIVSVNN